jgi:ubiquinone/menaquinone biosynthesis C-methylase UbiE
MQDSAKINYTLQVGAAGKTRLDILNKIYNPASQQFLSNAGLSKGMHILEVGCGTGAMTCWLAQQVGANGRVVAVDQSEEQLQITRENVQAARLANVSYAVLSATELNQLNKKFDLIYSRWLLMHLPNPLAALHSMYDCLNTNGILTCEDGAQAGSFCYPPSPLFDKWLAAWAHRFNYYGKDYNSGLKLPALFAHLPCRIETIKLFQPVLMTTEEKSVIPLNVEESTQAIVNSGFLTLAETQAFINDLSKFIEENHFIGYLRNTQIAAYK